MTRAAGILAIVLAAIAAVLVGWNAVMYSLGATRSQVGHGLLLPMIFAAAAAVFGIAWGAGEFADRRRR